MGILQDVMEVLNQWYLYGKRNDQTLKNFILNISKQNQFAIIK